MLVQYKDSRIGWGQVSEVASEAEFTFPHRMLRRLLPLAFASFLPVALQAAETSLTAPGASDDLLARLKSSSSVITAQASGLEGAQELLAAALSDYKTLVQVLYDSGYFGPDISIRIDGREAANVSLVEPPRKIDRIDIRVTPGTAFRFGTARIAPLPPEAELPEGFAPGEPASTGAIRAAAAAGRDAWRQRGHAKAEIGEQNISANHRQAQLNADIRLIPGPELRFGKLDVTGESRVRAASIQRIAALPSGETYSPEEARRAGARLRRTGTFSSVSIVEAETPNPDGTLDFTAEVADLPPRRISFGAEIASNDGVTLSAAWMHRNLFGNAERFRIEGEIRNIGGSEDIDGRLAFRLDNPARLGGDNNLFYYGSLERFDREHYTMNQAALGVGVRRVSSDQLFGEAAVQISTSRVSDAYGTDRRFDLISFPLRGQYDGRDSEQNPTTGYFVDLSITPFVGFADSSSGVSMLADGRAYRSLTTTGSLVLAGRLQIGSVVGAPASEVSPDLLFFSGGSGTVRGQSYESLGIPVGNDVAGGRSMIVASAEVRTRVTDAISLVGFFDYGMIDESSFVTSASQSHSGAGLGVRYDLGGFGPLRLDLALPVSGPEDNGLQFYIGIGQAF